MTLMLLMNLDFAGGGGAVAPETASYAAWQSSVVFSGWLLWLLVSKAVSR